MSKYLDDSEYTKGITTQEGRKMAKQKNQIDKSKADLDNDGLVSPYEQARSEAIQDAMADDPEQDEKYGMNCGGMMEPDMDVDPVSGNPIPPGVKAENVRDDIPAWLSEGEYVLPADVVKWHGLKHIMEMQDEAKMGLMMMTDMGLIVETDMAEQETCDNCPENKCEDCPFKATEEEAETETEETPEGNEVEYPTVETVEEEIIEGETSEDYDEEEEYASDNTASMFGVMKKPKLTFII